jgi:hypothetical protein
MEWLNALLSVLNLLRLFTTAQRRYGRDIQSERFDDDVLVDHG